MYSLSRREGRRAWRPIGVVLSFSAWWVLAAPGAVAAAPAGRGYELVTPPDIGTHVFAPVGTANPGIPQTWNPVATDGSKVLWNVRVALPGVDSTGRTDSYLAQRGPSGWSSAYVSPPGSQAAYGTNLMLATPDLDHLIWQAFWASIDPTDHDPAPNPGQAINSTQYSDLYRRDSDGRFTRITQGSQAPPVAAEGNTVVGSSPDGQMIVFNDTRALEPGALSDSNVYERRGGTTTLVSLDENDVAVADARGLASSDNGDVVVFRSALANNNLYVRDRGLTRTVNLHSSAIMQFESLSADGRKLLFLTAGALTGDDADSSVDLYEYDDTTGIITRLSKPDGAGGAGPGNTDTCAISLPSLGQCDVAAVAVRRDGSKAYFVSPEQLDGTKGIDGGVNLYLAQSGTVRFVATLDSSDPDFGAINGSITGSPLARHVRFTPDGSKLLFESRARLTSYDNAGHVEIYLHDPAAGLLCVSCRPDGTAPNGDASLRDGTGGSRVQFSTEPMYPANADEHGQHIFFQSTDTIVPQDLNRQYDVYERNLVTGATALISSGTSPNDSIYLGNGVDGKDVFFFTTDTLVPQDHNGGLFKLYDARVGGGDPPPPPAPPSCVADGCRGSAAPTPGISPSGTGLTGTGSSSAGAGGQFAPRAKVSVSGARSVRGTSGRLSVKVSGPGQLRASGSGVVARTVTAKRSATYRVIVRLSERMRAKLHRVGRLSVRVTLRFVPTSGVARSVAVKMTFISTSKKGRA